MKALGFRSVYTLAGDLDDRNTEELFPAQPADDTATAKAEFAKCGAVARHFDRAPSAPPAKKKRAGG